MYPGTLRRPLSGVARGNWYRLQNQALFALSTLPGEERGSRGRLEHLTDTLVRLGRAFEVLVGSNLLPDLLSLQFGQRMARLGVHSVCCLPAPEILASGKSLRAPRWSWGRVVDRTCSRPV